MTKKPLPPSDLADKFMLRMPDGMRERIAEVAKANNRSMNSEIIARLEASLTLGDTGQKEASLAKHLTEHQHEMRELRERLMQLDERLARADRLKD